MKKQNGITIIALTITIIVILILAGVTIVTLTGDNGLLTKANDAKMETERSALREEIDLLLLQAKMEENFEKDSEKNLKKLFGNDNVKQDGAVYEISYKGNTFFVSSNYEYIEIVTSDVEGEWNFDTNTQILTKYNKDIATKRGKQEEGEVIIPNYYNGKRVKGIGREVFRYNNANLKKLTISKGIETIGWATFYNASNLEGSLELPNTITSIDDYAFNKCSMTGDLIIPDSVTSIGQYSFAQCKSLNGKLKLSNNLTKIGADAFLRSTISGDLIIPDSVTSIGDRAFYSCSSLNGTLKLGNNVQTIGANAFQGCKFTGNLIIPDSVISIESEAFRGLESLNGKLVLGKNLQTIGWAAFCWCKNITGEVIIPENVTLINNDVFGTCYSITSIKFLKSDTQINSIPQNAVIYGYANSTAQAYAEANNKRFELIPQ